jgi:hypothetical protein
MGVTGDVISVGPNGPSVEASSKRWLGDVITVGPNGPSVDESSMRLLGDVITEGPDGPSLGTYLVVIIYMHYIYILLVYMWECG